MLARLLSRLLYSIYSKECQQHIAAMVHTCATGGTQGRVTGAAGVAQQTRYLNFAEIRKFVKCLRASGRSLELPGDLRSHLNVAVYYTSLCRECCPPSVSIPFFLHRGTQEVSYWPDHQVRIKGEKAENKSHLIDLGYTFVYVHPDIVSFCSLSKIFLSFQKSRHIVDYNRNVPPGIHHHYEHGEEHRQSNH